MLGHITVSVEALEKGYEEEMEELINKLTSCILPHYKRFTEDEIGEALEFALFNLSREVGEE